MIRYIKRWYERWQTRRALLATPGVDRLVRTVMDKRYGKHGWRVRLGVLEANVTDPMSGQSWWGPIGPLHHAYTRKWLIDMEFPDTQPMEGA